MGNPAHLAADSTAAPRRPPAHHSLGRRDVRYINKAYHRTGTLWDSRYKWSLVQEDTY
jgi:putative transposase